MNQRRSHRCTPCVAETQPRGGSVSVLDSGAEGPGFKSQSWRCRVTVSGKLFTPIVNQAAKLVAALLRVAGLAESNGSLPPGLWLTSPAGWLPRPGISSGTLRSVIEYGLPLPFWNSTQPNLTHALTVKFLDTTQINPWLDPMHDDDTLLGVVHKSTDP